MALPGARRLHGRKTARSARAPKGRFRLSVVPSRKQRGLRDIAMQKEVMEAKRKVRQWRERREARLPKFVAEKPIDKYIVWLMFEVGMHPQAIQELGLVQPKEWTDFINKNKLAVSQWKTHRKRLNPENLVEIRWGNKIVVAEAMGGGKSNLKLGLRVLWVAEPQHGGKWKRRPVASAKEMLGIINSIRTKSAYRGLPVRYPPPDALRQDK